MEDVNGQEKCSLIIFYEPMKILWGGHTEMHGGPTVGITVRVDDTIYGNTSFYQHFNIEHYTGNRVLVLEHGESLHMGINDTKYFTSEHRIELQGEQNIYRIKIIEGNHIVDRLDSIPPMFYNYYIQNQASPTKVEYIIEEKPKVKWYSL